MVIEYTFPSIKAIHFWWNFFVKTVKKGRFRSSVFFWIGMVFDLWVACGIIWVQTERKMSHAK